MGGSVRQLPLDLRFLASQGREDFILGECNGSAANWIDRWPDWPGQYTALNLVGPSASGKSHLAGIWRERSGACLLDGLPQGVRLDDLGEHLVLDDMAPGPKWNEEALFHVVDAAMQPERSLLLVSREPVARMSWQLADLGSRLRSVQTANLGQPDDEVLRWVLEKHFEDRKLVIAEHVIDYMLARIERSFAAVQAVADEMDRQSLAQHRNLTLPLAREILGTSEAGGAGDDSSGRDNTTTGNWPRGGMDA